MYVPYSSLCQINFYTNTSRIIFKPDTRWPMSGAYLVSQNCFSADICMHVCLSVCLSLRLLITSGVLWYDMVLICLIEQVLQSLYDSYSQYH